jgi:hypothetical protein
MQNDGCATPEAATFDHAITFLILLLKPRFG